MSLFKTDGKTVSARVRTGMSRRLLLLAWTLFGTASGSLWAQNYNDMYNQWASMEYKQWKFTPKSWYYSVWYKRVLGIKIPVFGLGVHDNGPANIGVGGDHYVDERWRQMSPLRISTTLSAISEKKTVNDVKEQWDSICTVELRNLVDHTVNVATFIDKDGRNLLIGELTNLITSLTDKRVRRLAEEYYKIQRNLDIIGGAFVPNGKKIKAYTDELDRLKKLKRNSALYRIVEQQSKIYMPKEQPADDKLLNVGGFNAQF